MKKLAIIGAGDLGFQIAYHAFTDGHYQPVGFFDDYKDTNFHLFGLPVIGSTEDIEAAFNEGVFDVLMIGIGYKHFDIRSNLYNRFKNIIPFGSIIHSSAYIDKSCHLESGIIIYPGCILDMNVEIDNNVLINIGCVISHDSKVGQHSFIAPSVSIAGFVEIGQKVNLGIGTTVISKIKICDNVRTGGGTVVINDIDLPGLYVGVPACFKKP